MPTLSVIRPVALRAIVTEKLKEELRAELQEAADSTRRRIEQMDFRARHLLADLQRTNLTQAMAARTQIEAERNRHESMRKELLDHISEIEGLELGSEYPRGTIDSIVELKVGDNLLERLTNCAVVIKDGVVVEIRGL